MIEKILGPLNLAALSYKVACILCAVGFLYSIWAWFRKPPTRTLWGRSAQAWSIIPIHRGLMTLARSMVSRLVLQSYIIRRGRLRWLTHFAIAWGVVIAGGGSLLSLTWHAMGCSSVDQQTYTARILDAPLFDFQAHSFMAFLVFNAIKLGSLLLLGGLVLALLQRFTVRQNETAERPREHLVALYLLLAVTVTGLLIPVSYEFLEGFAYDQLAYLHEIVVIVGLLWLPFGKLFHLAVSPATVALDLTERAGLVEPSRCSCCNRTLSSVWSPDDLRGTLASAGLAVREGVSVPAELSLCPLCRQRRQAALLRLGTGRSSCPVDIRNKLGQEA